MNRSRNSEQRSAIILAGGDGRRLRALTRRIAGADLPKQFCRVMGRKTLLEETLERALLAVPGERIFTAVNRAHERFYAPLLGADSANVVAQPENRGTAPAILYSLMRLAGSAPASTVALFPSDHYVNDAGEFVAHVMAAFAAVDERPELTILLGMAPNGPERGYGWIEPGGRVEAEVPVFKVQRFIEKPDDETALRLWRSGALWNSFVMVSRASSLLGMFMMVLPQLFAAFNLVRPAMGTIFERASIERLYADLDEINFSEAVLAKSPLNLAVLPVTGIEWSDLGDPRRVVETWSRAGIHPAWEAA